MILTIQGAREEAEVIGAELASINNGAYGGGQSSADDDEDVDERVRAGTTCSMPLRVLYLPHILLFARVFSCPKIVHDGSCRGLGGS